SKLVDQVAERLKMTAQLVDLKEQLSHAVPELDLATESLTMRAAIDGLSRAADHIVPVLLRGENGSGKSVLARWMHTLGPRRNRPFVLVNCPTLSEDLLSSELFGHARGAFTGAVQDRAGKVETAEGGTLFLDEIGELTSPLQSKLLRFL